MEVEWDDDGMRWIVGTRLLAFTKQPSPHTANMLASITFMVNSAVLHSNWRSQCIILMLATRIPGIDNKMGMIQNQKYFVRQVVRRNKNIPHICTFKDLLGTVPLAELGSLVPVNDWFIYSGCHCPKAYRLHDERFFVTGKVWAMAENGGPKKLPPSGPRKKWPFIAVFLTPEKR